METKASTCSNLPNLPAVKPGPAPGTPTPLALEQLTTWAGGYGSRAVHLRSIDKTVALCGQRLGPKADQLGVVLPLDEAHVMKQQGWGNLWDKLPLGTQATCHDCIDVYQRRLSGGQLVGGRLEWVAPPRQEVPPGLIHPGRVLEIERKYEGFTLNELEKRLGNRYPRPLLAAIEAGTQPFTRHLASSLAGLFVGIPPGYWVELVKRWEEDVAAPRGWHQSEQHHGG